MPEITLTLTELEREAARHGMVLIARDRLTCPVCRGLGIIDGFWLGTTKTCPSCHGKGYR